MGVFANWRVHSKMGDEADESGQELAGGPACSAVSQPRLTQFDAAWGVPIEQSDCGASLRCQAGNASAPNGEVIAPGIVTRIEQRHNGSAIGIDAGQIRSFIRIAAVTRERQRTRLVRATMLARHDVMNMKGNQRSRILG